MKNFVILVFLMMIVFPFELSASGASVGANVWYAWTEPENKEEFMGKNESTGYNNNFDMTENAAIVYGGLFSVQFTDRISLGGVFSYGTGWKCKADYVYNPKGTEIHMFKDFNDIKRFEGDLTINYTLNEIFKIFLGWKYLASRGNGEYYYFPTSTPSAIFRGKFERQFDSTGPGVGFTTIFNIAENLYLITTLSAIYEKSKTATKITGITNLADNKESDYSSNYFGGNGTINLAYVIPETRVTISSGGRYQHLKNLDSSGKIVFYGAVLSAIYAF